MYVCTVCYVCMYVCMYVCKYVCMYSMYLCMYTGMMFLSIISTVMVITWSFDDDYGGSDD